MVQKEYEFNIVDLESQLPYFSERGITELAVHDKQLAADKMGLLRLLAAIAAVSPDLIVVVQADIKVICKDICNAAAGLSCSLEIPLTGISKSDREKCAYLFDKQVYAKKADLLNEVGVIFGFDMEWGMLPGDSLKMFLDRLEFAVSLYPNHIDFSQLEENAPAASPTGSFSSRDIRHAAEIAFACVTFYSSGRAVPWFISVLEPLKISAVRFFEDFAEWQRCDNCGVESNFDPSIVSHADIEKMQLVFLQEKYEEKHKSYLFPIIQDIVKMNGAFARLTGEGEECELDISYNPDDILGPEIFDIPSFAETVCLEPHHVRIYAGPDGPDYRILI